MLPERDGSVVAERTPEALGRCAVSAPGRTTAAPRPPSANWGMSANDSTRMPCPRLRPSTSGARDMDRLEACSRSNCSGLRPCVPVITPQCSAWPQRRCHHALLQRLSTETFYRVRPTRLAFQISVDRHCDERKKADLRFPALLGIRLAGAWMVTSAAGGTVRPWTHSGASCDANVGKAV